MTETTRRLNLNDVEIDRLRAHAPGVLEAIRTVRSRALTYLSDRALAELAWAALSIEAEQLPGVFLEAGTALGGSAVVLAAAKSSSRPLRLYDVFGMIPPPTDVDGPDVHERYELIVSGESKGLGGGTYYGYHEDLTAEVRGVLAACGYPPVQHNIELVQGMFQDTLPGADPVALAHLDGDWYESTKTCLERIAGRVVRGGRIVIDDYDMWSGCRRAVDEFLAGPRAAGFERRKKARLQLVRTQ